MWISIIPYILVKLSLFFKLLYLCVCYFVLPFLVNKDVYISSFLSFYFCISIYVCLYFCIFVLFFHECFNAAAIIKQHLSVETIVGSSFVSH